ncbi:tetratricopeptide repeat protein [Undibacterium sp. Ji22W]|uniref:tetratricopeptide repeat protein n=1 Tax=Undibacterium sp. Ji22W TaxID=3413038 RepID=UPI003BF0568B
MKKNPTQFRQLNLFISTISLSLLGAANNVALAQSGNDQIPYTKPVNTKNTKNTKVKPTPTAPQTKTDNTATESGLSKDILYKLTASDIALQRGEWQSPFITIMGLAQQTRDPRLAKRAAEIAMSAQQVDESLAAVRLWRELATDSPEAEQYYLSLIVIKSDYVALEQFFLKLLENSSGEERNGLIHQAQITLNRTGDKKAALLSLEKILVKDNSSLAGHIALSRAAYRSGDAVRAQQEAQAALAIEPSSELGILTLAHASEKNVAFALVADFLKRYPQAKEVHLAYATMLLESKQLRQAKTEFLSFLQNPEKTAMPRTQVLYTLGSIEMEMGQLDAAENFFKEMIEKINAGEDSSSAYISLAQIALQRKDKQNADLWLSKISKVDNKDEPNPVWFNIQMRRALLLASDGKYREARQFLQTINANKEAEQALLLQTEAQIMREAGQTTEAFVLLQMAVGEFPGSPDLLYDLAMLSESLKYYPEMEMALKQLIQVAPNNALAYNALGYSYADRNVHLDEALSLLEIANQLNPNDPYILDSLGWVKFRLKSYNEAEKFLRQSLSMRQDADVSIHLAEILWSQDKKEEAMQLFTDANRKDPQNALLKNTLQRLTLTLP